MDSIISILNFLCQTFENEFIITGSVTANLPSSAQMTRIGLILHTRTTYTVVVRNPAMFGEYLDWQNNTEATTESITWFHMDSRSSVRICIPTRTILVHTLPYSNEFIADLRAAAGNFTVSLRIIDPQAPQ